MFRFLTELKALREQQAETDRWMRAMTLQREADARLLTDLAKRVESMENTTLVDFLMNQDIRTTERLAELESKGDWLKDLAASVDELRAEQRKAEPKPAVPEVAPAVAGAIRAMSGSNGRLAATLERDARLMKRGGMSDEAIAASLLAGDVA